MVRYPSFLLIGVVVAALCTLIPQGALAQGAVVVPDVDPSKPLGIKITLVDYAGDAPTVLDVAAAYQPIVAVHGAQHTAYVPVIEDDPEIFTETLLIKVIDTVTRAVVRTVQSDVLASNALFTAVVVSPSNDVLHFYHQDGSLVSISTVTGETISSIPVGLSAGGFLAVHPAGNLVYVGGPQQTKVVDLARQAVVATLPVSGSSGSIGFSADGSRAKLYDLPGQRIVSYGTSDHALVDARPLPLLFGTASAFTFSHDATRFHVASSTGTLSRLRTYSALTGTLMRESVVFPTAYHWAAELARSRDGSRLYLVSGSGSSQTLTIFNTADLSFRASVDLADRIGGTSRTPLNDFTGAAASLPDPLDTAEAHIAELQQQVASLEAELTVAADANGTLTARVNDLLTQLGDANARIAALEDQVAALSPGAGTFAAQILALQTQLTAAEVTIASLQTQVSLLVSEKAQLTARVASLTSERDTWKALVPSNQSPSAMYALVPVFAPPQPASIVRVSLGNSSPREPLPGIIPAALAVHRGTELLATIENQRLTLRDLPSGVLLVSNPSVFFSDVHSMFFNRAGDRLFVADRFSISMFETGALARVASFEQNSSQLVSSDDGRRLFALDFQKLTAINGSTFSVMATKNLAGPRAVAANADGSKVYVADAQGLLELDGATLQQLRRVDASAALPISFALKMILNRSGTRLFVSSQFTRYEVHVLDTATLGLVHGPVVLDGEPRVFALQPDGARVLQTVAVARPGGVYDIGVQEFDAASGQLMSSTPVAGGLPVNGDFAGSHEAMVAPAETALTTVALQLGEIATLTGIITAKNGELAAKTTQIATLTGDKTTLTQQKATLEGEKAALISDKALLEQQKTALEGQNAALARQNTDLAGEKQALLALNETLNDQKAVLEADKSSLEQQKAALETEKSTLGQQKAALETEKTTLQQQNATLESEKSALEQLNASLTVEKDTLAQRTATLEQQKATLESEKSALEQRQAALQTQLAEVLSQNTELQAELAATGQTIASLQALLANGQASLDAFESAMQQVFVAPGFQLPGGTQAQQLQALVVAIDGLNHGQKQALFKNLGGQKK